MGEAGSGKRERPELQPPSTTIGGRLGVAARRGSTQPTAGCRGRLHAAPGGSSPCDSRHSLSDHQHDSGEEQEVVVALVEIEKDPTDRPCHEEDDAKKAKDANATEHVHLPAARGASPAGEHKRRVACVYGETIARLPQASGLSCSFRVLIVMKIDRARAESVYVSTDPEDHPPRDFDHDIAAKEKTDSIHAAAAAV